MQNNTSSVQQDGLSMVNVGEVYPAVANRQVHRRARVQLKLPDVLLSFSTSHLCEEQS
jgi:hypothetical protein